MTTPLAEGDPLHIGSITLEARIGEGGSATLYLGRSPKGDPVAVKVLHRHLAASQAVRDLLRTEATALERVRGSRVARVLEVAADADQPYLVVEYIPGTSLAESVSNGPLTGVLLASVLDGVAEALEEIHAAGVVHRDLKPSNVIYGRDGVRVVDFGISDIDDIAGTASGTFAGTPAWLSPEQARGVPVTPASDVFNYGMLIAFVSTGRNPFGEGRADAMLYRVVNEQPDLSEVPSYLRNLAAACLAKDPAARPSIEAVRQQLARLGGTSGGAADLPTNTTVVASATVLGRAAHAEVSGVADRIERPSGRPKKRRRGLIVTVAVVLVAVLAGLGVVVANAVAPFGGPIKLTYVDTSTSNHYLDRPTIRIDVVNGEGRELELPVDSGNTDIGTWHPNSSITVAFVPAFKNDEPFEHTWSASELGLGYLQVTRSLWVSVGVTDNAVTVDIYADLSSGNDAGVNTVTLARGNEQTYRRGQAVQYEGCVSSVNLAWRGDLVAMLDVEAAYDAALSGNQFSQGGTADLSVWSERARGVADDLVVYESHIISGAPPVENPPFTTDVADASDSVWYALENVRSAWDDYADILGDGSDHSAGQLEDLFPRENALIDAAVTGLSDSVNTLVATIPAGARSTCDAQYPDRQK